MRAIATVDVGIGPSGITAGTSPEGPGIVVAVAGTNLVLWKYGYDPADQLTSAVKESTDPTPQVLKRYAYTYDPAGNRTVEQIDDAITLTSHDKLNRLVTQVPGGPMIFAGTVNEPASVTIQGAPATVSSTNDFRGTASLTTGTNTVTIVATDPSGNSTTRQWTVDVVGQAKTFTFDANGNLTSDGTRTFEWDARNQLIAIDVATRRTEFTYDGLQRRVRVVEKNNEIVQSETKVVWCGNEHCEERGGDGTTVNRRSFALGEQTGGSARLFAIDHLGSVNIVTDVAATQLGAFTYDPWGRRTIVSGSAVTNAGFTGHNWQADGALWLTQYRGFDTDAGRWLSEDPIRFLGGDNFFAYVANNPVNRNDPSGLAPDSCPTCTPRFHTASYYSCLLTTTGGAGVAFATCLAAKRFYGPAAAVVCEVVGLAGWIGLCIQCATYCDGPGQGPGRDCFDGSELPPNRPNVGPPPPNRWPPVRRK